MYVDLAIHLFFLPDIELDEYELTGAGLRQYAADLCHRLGAVGAVVDRLRGDGWVVKVVRNNLEARHPQVKTYAEAVARLNRLRLEEGRNVNDIAEWSDVGSHLIAATASPGWMPTENTWIAPEVSLFYSFCPGPMK